MVAGAQLNRHYFGALCCDRNAPRSPGPRLPAVHYVDYQPYPCHLIFNQPEFSDLRSFLLLSLVHWCFLYLQLMSTVQLRREQAEGSALEVRGRYRAQSVQPAGERGKAVWVYRSRPACRAAHAVPCAGAAAVVAQGGAARSLAGGGGGGNNRAGMGATSKGVFSLAEGACGHEVLLVRVVVNGTAVSKHLAPTASPQTTAAVTVCVSDVSSMWHVLAHQMGQGPGPAAGNEGLKPARCGLSPAG